MPRVAVDCGAGRFDVSLLAEPGGGPDMEEHTPHPTGSDAASDEAKIELTDSTGRLGRVVSEWLVDHAALALRHLHAPGTVRINVVLDPEMASMHEEFTGVAGTTDVLTFDLREEPRGPLDTDIIVCLDEAARQAATRDHRPEHELLLYVVHGVLHCLGHDDHDDDDFKAMHDAEDAVLRAIGVGALFSRQASPDANSPATERP